jgi:hypothetical protein
MLNELLGETRIERGKSIAIAVLAIVALISLQQLASTRAQLNSRPAAEAQALDAAKAFAAALTTYDYRNLDVQNSRLQGLVTSGVMDTIRKSQPDLVSLQASSNGSAVQAYLQGYSDDTATAVVQTEQTVSSIASPHGASASGLFMCQLELASGGWRVSSYQWLTPATAATP